MKKTVSLQKVSLFEPETDLEPFNFIRTESTVRHERRHSILPITGHDEVNTNLNRDAVAITSTVDEMRDRFLGSNACRRLAILSCSTRFILSVEIVPVYNEFGR